MADHIKAFIRYRQVIGNCGKKKVTVAPSKSPDGRVKVIVDTRWVSKYQLFRLSHEKQRTHAPGTIMNWWVQQRISLLNSVCDGFRVHGPGRYRLKTTS